MVKLKKTKLKNKGTKKPAQREKLSDAARVGRVLGKKSGLNVSAWWNKQFTANRKAKLTDAQLLAAFKAEFPKRNPQPIGQVRSFFNRGISGFGTGDGKRQQNLSVAYDKSGNVTESDWTKTKKVDPKRSAIAKARALKGWKKKNRKKRVDARSGSRVPVHVKAGKAKAKKLAAKKGIKPGELSAARHAAKKTKKTVKQKPTPAGKTKFKFKVGKNKAA